MGRSSFKRVTLRHAQGERHNRDTKEREREKRMRETSEIKRDRVGEEEETPNCAKWGWPRRIKPVSGHRAAQDPHEVIKYGTCPKELQGSWL